MKAVFSLVIAIILIGSMVSQTGIAFAVTPNSKIAHNSKLHSITPAHVVSSQTALKLPAEFSGLVNQITSHAAPTQNKKTMHDQAISALSHLVPNSLLVTFKSTASSSDISNSISSVNAKSIKSVTNIKSNGNVMSVQKLTFATSTDTDAAIVKLKSDPNVKYVSKENSKQISSISLKALSNSQLKKMLAPTTTSGTTIQSITSDPMRKYQWHLPKIGEDLTAQTPGVIEIAQLDTGVDYNHEDLSGKIIKGYDYVNNDPDPIDDAGHGTFVAGEMVAAINNGIGIAGISPNSKILAMKVCDLNGICPDSAILQAITDATANPDVKIITMSLGGLTPAPGSANDDGTWALWNSAIANAIAAGKIVVAAGGNDADIETFTLDDLTTPGYDYVTTPATIPGVVSVAATDKHDARAYFSNYATNSSKAMSNIAAPGEDIVSTYCDVIGAVGTVEGQTGCTDTNTYGIGSGTSFSTPITTASLARVWSQQALDVTTATKLVGQSNFMTSKGASPTRFGSGEDPLGAAFDSLGNLWVSDSQDNRILMYPKASLGTINAPATVVLGQPNFVSTISSTTPSGLNFPAGIAFDSTGNLWVADSDNNRVLMYPKASLATNGAQATIVLGQSNGYSSYSFTSKTGLSHPSGLAFDSTGNLWVVDRVNQRVLMYPKSSLTTNNAPATVVLGQANFFASTPNHGLGGGATNASGLNYPTGLAFNSTGHLFVVDDTNHRVLIFPPNNLVMNGAATGVLGQSDFTTISSGTTSTNLYYPYGIRVDSTTGNILISDNGNSRVLMYPKSSLGSSGPAATVVLGQADFTHGTRNRGSTTPAANTLAFPTGLTTDSTGNLWVIDDSNSRVLMYPKANIVTGGVATIVLGQTTMTSINDAASNILMQPGSTAFDSTGNLWVTDSGNNRVLMFPKATLGTLGASATIVLGQTNFNTAISPSIPTKTSLSYPTSPAFDSTGNLWVADTGNNRVLMYPKASLATNGASATIVLGQVKFTQNISNHGLGGSSTDATGLNGPQSVTFNSTNGNLVIADSFNNRVLIYPKANLVNNGTGATVAIGQIDLNSNTPGTTSTNLYIPTSSTIDPTGNLWVTDSGNNRVLMYPKSSLGSSGPAATVVIGQRDMSSFGTGTTPHNFNDPYALAFDSTGNLWVTDSGNNRVLMYPSNNLVTNVNATVVIGQNDMYSHNFNLGQTGLIGPHGLSFDSAGTLWVSDSNNRVLGYPSVALVTKNKYDTALSVVPALLNTGVNIPKDYGFPTNNLPVGDPHRYIVNRTDISAALGILPAIRTGIQGQVWDVECHTGNYETQSGSDVPQCPLYGAAVTAKGPVTRTVQTNVQGIYTFTNLPAGTYTVTSSLKGFIPSSDTVLVSTGKMTQSSLQDDFYMPTVKSAGINTIVTSWNFEQTGFEELQISTSPLFSFPYSPFEHPDMLPYNTAAGVGGGVNGYLRALSNNTMASIFTTPGPSKANPTQLISSLSSNLPAEVFTYQPTKGISMSYSISDNPFGLGWGSMSKLKAITKVYGPTSLITSIDGSTATGTADYWEKVFTQSGTGPIVTINNKIPEFGTITSSSPQAVLVNDGISNQFGTIDGLNFINYNPQFGGPEIDYTPYYEDLLNATFGGYNAVPYTYNEWNTMIAGPPTAQDIGAVNKPVIWFTGDDWAQGLKANERSTISSLESSGHKLYLTGQYAAQNLGVWNSPPGTLSVIGILYNSGPTSFLNNVLGADWINFNSFIGPSYSALGINGSPISDPFSLTPGDEIAFIIGGDSADNQSPLADVIVPHIGSQASADWTFTDNTGTPQTSAGGEPANAGVHYASGANKVVFQSIGLEGIDSPDMRSQILQDVLSYFGP